MFGLVSVGFRIVKRYKVGRYDQSRDIYYNLLLQSEFQYPLRTINSSILFQSSFFIHSSRDAGIPTYGIYHRCIFQTSYDIL